MTQFGAMPAIVSAVRKPSSLGTEPDLALRSDASSRAFSVSDRLSTVRHSSAKSGNQRCVVS